MTLRKSAIGIAFAASATVSVITACSGRPEPVHQGYVNITPEHIEKLKENETLIHRTEVNAYGMLKADFEGQRGLALIMERGIYQDAGSLHDCISAAEKHIPSKGSYYPPLKMVVVECNDEAGELVSRFQIHVDTTESDTRKIQRSIDPDSFRKFGLQEI